MKRNRIVASALTFAMLCTFALTGCGSSTGGGDKTKVGMVTDSGTISDRSFNQGTWEGIKKYEKDKGTISSEYLQPSGEQETDYLNAINDLVDNKYNLIVTPGFKFETAINKAATEHGDTTFILIDGQPHASDKDLKFVKHDNVVSVFFNEHEAGFLAGVAAALSTKTNKLGFIGGMEIPAVQKFGWGYQAGVKYANDTFGTKAEIINYVYQGTFNDIQAGQTLAAGMYDKGADIIFHASGSVGIGVFNEAKQRASNGKNVWVIGVDSDQYELGKISKEKDSKSVTLTSAVKKVDVAAYDFIDDKLNNKFPGGEVVTLTLKDGAVGLPKDNPNLSDDVKAKLEEAKKALLDGKVKAPSTEAELKAFLK
ncbi:MAG TPA: BMP family ABC transporter substrate-binding protein [Ruminiclostridium sp.]|nr:BMP family ABC transporter substrate-binding protein [Ruminiclostridium sp.]